MSVYPQIMGIDPSLTATGIALPDGTTLTIRSKHRGMERLADIRQVIITLAAGIDLVIIEGYSYGSGHGAHQLGELGGTLRLALWDAAIPYLEIAPTQRAKYATGRGNAAKNLVISELSARTGRTFPDDNQADAYILYAMALDHYGHPIIDVPKTHRDALQAVTWPDLNHTP